MPSCRRFATRRRSAPSATGDSAFGCAPSSTSTGFWIDFFLPERHKILIRFTEYILLASSSLFVIIDPLATVPAFLAMTPADSVDQRRRAARLACSVAAGILAGFALSGNFIFHVMGITMPAFQIAASVVLMQVSLDMLRAQRSRVKETSEETQAGVDKTEIAITPLGIPMLAGPGAISTTILLQNEARDFAQRCALLVCILAVCFASYLILRLAAGGGRWLGPIAMSLAVRIMGLLLASVAVQFMLNGFKAFWVQLHA